MWGAIQLGHVTSFGQTSHIPPDAKEWLVQTACGCKETNTGSVGAHKILDLVMQTGRDRRQGYELFLIPHDELRIAHVIQEAEISSALDLEWAPDLA